MKANVGGVDRIFRLIDGTVRENVALGAHVADDAIEAALAVAGETENFIEGWLARAVVADREFADPEQRLEQHQVSTHAARQGREGDVIAAGVAERVEAFLAQSMNLRQQVARSACAS